MFGNTKTITINIILETKDGVSHIINTKKINKPCLYVESASVRKEIKEFEAHKNSIKLAMLGESADEIFGKQYHRADEMVNDKWSIPFDDIELLHLGEYIYKKDMFKKMYAVIDD